MSASRLPADELETPRLRLRRFRAGDWRDLHEYLSLPAVLEFEPGEAKDEAECQELAAERAGSDAFWAVCLARSGKLIGHLSLVPLRPAELLTWELGYIFNPAYGGQGYATEACRRLLAHAFGELGAHRLVALCRPENELSWRLLERLGMRREGRLEQHAFFRRGPDGEPLWHDGYEYAILAEEWRAGSPERAAT